MQNSDVSIKGDLPGTPKDMGPPYSKRDPYHSHIFTGVGLGNSMGSLPKQGPMSLGGPENPIDSNAKMFKLDCCTTWKGSMAIATPTYWFIIGSCPIIMGNFSEKWVYLQ